MTQQKVYMNDLASLCSAWPWAPRFKGTNPVIPSSLRALATAFIQLPFFMRWPCLNCFLVINRPLLERQRSFLIRPLLVKTLLPFHTMRMLPVWLFLVTRLEARTFFAALGALGFCAWVALLALRTAVLTAMVCRGKV